MVGCWYCRLQHDPSVFCMARDKAFESVKEAVAAVEAKHGKRVDREHVGDRSKARKHFSRMESASLARYRAKLREG